MDDRWHTIRTDWARNRVPFVPDVMDLCVEGLSTAGRGLLYEAVPDAALRWAQLHDTIDVVASSKERIAALQGYANESGANNIRMRERVDLQERYDRVLWVAGGHALLDGATKVATLSSMLTPGGQIQLAIVFYEKMIGDSEWEVVWSGPIPDDPVPKRFVDAFVGAGLQVIDTCRSERSFDVPSVRALLVAQGLAPGQHADAGASPEESIHVTYGIYTFTARAS